MVDTSAQWVERWDGQQERFLPDRETRFRLMGDYLEQVRGSQSLRLLDLCCGNGSISKRILDRIPSAIILAVDFDPAHLEVGRQTLGNRVEWRDADLRQPDWAQDLPDRSFDGVLTATALH